MHFEDEETEDQELKRWKKENGYLVCHYFNGGSLLTVVKKSHWDELYSTETSGRFWNCNAHCAPGDSLYIRILSAELTWIFPNWLAKLTSRVDHKDEV